MDEPQQRIIELLTEIRDLQKANFERARRVARLIRRRQQRDTADAKRLRDEVRADNRKLRIEGIVLTILVFCLALRFLVPLLIWVFAGWDADF